MSQRDISEQTKSLYDVDISPELVSKIMPEVTARQDQPLETVYPQIYMSCTVTLLDSFKWVRKYKSKA